MSTENTSPILPISAQTSQNFTPLHNPPAQPPRLLSTRQLNAIPLILLGQSDHEVAESVGVSRETIWSWRNRHPRFIAELNRQRNALHASTVDRYLRLLNQSMKYIEEFQEYEHESWLQDQVKLATALLRAASRRALSPGNPLPTNPESILEDLLSQNLPPALDDQDSP